MEYERIANIVILHGNDINIQKTNEIIKEYDIPIENIINIETDDVCHTVWYRVPKKTENEFCEGCTHYNKLNEMDQFCFNCNVENDFINLKPLKEKEKKNES